MPLSYPPKMKIYPSELVNSGVTLLALARTYQHTRVHRADVVDDVAAIIFLCRCLPGIPAYLSSSTDADMRSKWQNIRWVISRWRRCIRCRCARPEARARRMLLTTS